MSKENVEDFKVFGDTLVYCGQHLAVHSTGWCAVDISEKMALGTKDEMAAARKCRRFSLPLYPECVLHKIKTEA